MKKEKVTVVFDRKKKLKDENGLGTVEVFVYLGRRERKFITIGKCKTYEFDAFQKRKDVKSIIMRCQKVISVLAFLNLEVNVENFNTYYCKDEEDRKEILQEPRSAYKGVDQNTDFIKYFAQSIEEERKNLAKGTFKHKLCTLEALKNFGQIKTFADLVPAKIAAWDEWLHDGKRGDACIYNYHKHIKKVVRYLAMMDKIPNNPYNVVKVKRGKCKMRRPLTEKEMVHIRQLKLAGKMEKARDLFIFASYTGLSYCDTMAFDFKKHTDKVGKIYYIDGSRLKTGSLFYTPILPPAMEVLKKWNFKLPHISDQKANDYLHLIEDKIGCRKSLTFHIGRHSFATLMLSHEIPMENLARMMGHKDIRVTQIYGKILNSTIESKTESIVDKLL